MNEKIQNYIQEILSRMSFEVQSITVSKDDDLQATFFTIETNDPELLIGRNGDVLKAINHLVYRFIEKETEYNYKENNFYIDVDGYYQRNIQEVKTKAKIVADRARSFKSDIALEPMSAYDRLIVHSYIAQFDDVETMSQGEGKDRHVVIKLKEV